MYVHFKFSKLLDSQDYFAKVLAQLNFSRETGREFVKGRLFWERISRVVDIVETYRFNLPVILVGGNYFSQNKLTKLAHLVQFKCMLIFCLEDWGKGPHLYDNSMTTVRVNDHCMAAV